MSPQLAHSAEIHDPKDRNDMPTSPARASGLRQRVLRALLVGVSLFSPGVAEAQQPSPSPPSIADLERRIRQLEETVRRLEAERARDHQASAATPPSGTPDPGATPEVLLPSESPGTLPDPGGSSASAAPSAAQAG